MKKAALHNLGCKVNAYETEAMQEMLERAGYEIVPFREGADVYIINTCTVTNIADRKSRQMLHRARKMNPDAIVVAAGCYVQAQAEKQEIDPCIDIVLGNNRKKDLIRVLEEYGMSGGEGRVREGEPVRDLDNISRTKEYEAPEPDQTGRSYACLHQGTGRVQPVLHLLYHPLCKRTSAQQEDGGRVREVDALADNGYREVVLTGIHLSSYGIDFDGERHLLDLIRSSTWGGRNPKDPAGIPGAGDHHRGIRRSSWLHSRRCVPISISLFRADATPR